MKRVLTAIILIPLVVLALFKAPLWLFTLLVLGVALLAAKEYFDIAEKTGFRPFRALGYFFLICLFYTCGAFAASNLYQQGSAWAHTDYSLATAIALLVVLSSPFVFLIASLRREPLSSALGDSSASFLLLTYVGFTLFALPILRSYENGAIFILFVMLIVWAGDIAAFYVGRAVGKHKLAPRVSPGKSWEGSVASAFAGVAVAVLLFRFLTPIWSGLHSIHLAFEPGYIYEIHHLGNVTPDFPPAPWWAAAAFALCVNVAAQFGDLVESALKRGAGMKDSGNLLPGHGGVLDRVDALLFAVPMSWLLYISGYSNYFTSRGIFDKLNH